MQDYPSSHSLLTAKLLVDKDSLLFFLMLLILAVLSFLSIFLGVHSISMFDIADLGQKDILIIAASRVPRLVSIIIAGIGMSVSGLIVQQISLNKFASPTTMGTLDAAKLGMVLSMIFLPAAGIFTKLFICFIISLASSALFLAIISKIKYKSLIFVPLIGIVLGNIISAAATFFAFKFNIIQNMEAWLIGDFSSVIKGNYELLYLAVPAVAVSYLYADKFTIAGLGKDASTALGLDYRKITYLGLFLIAVNTAAVVLTAGVIPFLGLIVPNIISLLFGDNLKKTLPFTAVFGALFLLLCDMAGRTLLDSYEVPIGLTVSIAGGAVFLILILKKARHA